METIRKYFALIFLSVFAILTIFIWYAVFYFGSRQNLMVTFFDIGQGDAILIETAARNQILIDGGPGTAILSKLGNILPFWDRSLDLLILTHPHADHLDGLLEVLKRYEVGRVLESGVAHSIPEYKEWHEIIEQKKIPVVIAKAGLRVDAGRGVLLDILSPFENFQGAAVRNVHDADIVGRLHYGSASILLMGDAEKTLEYRLLLESFNSKGSALSGTEGLIPCLEQCRGVDSDVLKVGHHGSKTSSVQEFLQAVSPDAAVIQAGRKNRYGHPNQEVLDRLSLVGAKIFRNDLDGDIQLKSNGITYEIGKK